MRWVAKAIAQKGMSALPAAGDLNYLAQRYVSRSLPSARWKVRRRFRRAARHLRAYEEHGPERRVEEGVFYEFGPGWELTEAIAFWCLGVDRHIVLDVRKNIRIELVNVTLARVHHLLPKLEELVERKLRDPGPLPLRSLSELEARFGIAYLAPRDARATGLDAACVDFVSSTSTLEHVPLEELRPLLGECRRLLRADGVISCGVDLGDHFSYFDPGISEYNFLRYSERVWRAFNSALAYQNRLRYPDYVRAFEDAGFEVVALEKGAPDDAQLAAVPVASELRRHYTEEELAVRWLTIVARPRGDGSSPDAS